MIEAHKCNDCDYVLCKDCLDEKKFTVICDNEHAFSVPSVVVYTKKERIVGKEGQKLMQKEKDIKNVVINVKRLMGTRFDDPKMKSNMKLIPATVSEGENGFPVVEIEDYLGEPMTKITPEEISAAILTKLVMMAKDHLGVKPTRAVITVPAHFNDGQRESTVKAG